MDDLAVMRTVLASLVLVSVSYTLPAEAGLPENCIERVESKSGQLIANVQAEVDRKHSRLENHHGAIEGAWQQFISYFRGAWVKECLDTYPEHKERYNAWLQTHAQPVSNAAAAKLAEVCTAYTTQLVDKELGELEAAVAEGRTTSFVSDMRSFEGHLTRPIVAQCKPIQEKLAQLKTTRIAALKDQVAMIEHERKLAGVLFASKSPFEQAEAALKTKGKKMVEAPGVFESAQAKVDLKTFLGQCVTEAGALRSLGKEPAYLVANPQARNYVGGPAGSRAPAPQASMPLGEAESFCTQALSDFDATVAKVEAHNAKYREAQAAAWEKANLKGAGMRRVYSENGKRWPAVENLGSKIVWTYRSYTTGAVAHECKEYTFSKSGKLLGRKVRWCN